jgi:hypothetical protein
VTSMNSCVGVLVCWCVKEVRRGHERKNVKDDDICEVDRDSDCDTP